MGGKLAKAKKVSKKPAKKRVSKKPAKKRVAKKTSKKRQSLTNQEMLKMMMWQKRSNYRR